MDVKTVIEVFISSIMVGFYFVLSGSKTLTCKVNKNLKTFIFIFLYVLFITVNYLFLDNFAKTITLYVVTLAIYKFLFNKNTVQSAISALLSYLLLVIGEILFMLVLTSLQKLGIINDFKMFAGSVIANLFVCLVAILVSFVISGPMGRIVSK